MYGIVLATALTCGGQAPAGFCHGNHYAYGLCFGACYGVCYGGWAGYGCYGQNPGGWGAPYGGYGPGYPPGYHGYPGYDCWGGCGGYQSPAYGVPMAAVIQPNARDLAPRRRDNLDTSTRAKLVFRLPQNARLYVDGQPVNSTGAESTFQTPALKPGQDYYYEVRAEVMRDGKPVSQTRRVIVKAGSTVQTDFTVATEEERKLAKSPR